ncbi:MAG TPA: 30S ribosomal protein S3ae [Thermoplasmata archaeon]|nr:30S ribosomal protein S3ae [Thermoplasmata archaeon]
MAKASKSRSRATARKLKDKWRSKQWYSIIAPDIFERKEIGQTPSDDPQKLIGRNLEVSLQSLTGNFRQSHIKLMCKITDVSGLNVSTVFTGHRLTTEHTRRLVQRRKSKMDGIVDVVTKDGGKIRVKTLLTTNKRINTSKQSLIVKAANDFIKSYARKKLFSEFINDMLSNTLSVQVFRHVKPIYPLKRVEIRRSEVLKFFSPHLPVEEEGDFDAVEEEEAEKKLEPSAEEGQATTPQAEKVVETE